MHGVPSFICAALVLALSIDISFQQTCSPTEFKCGGGECVADTVICDYRNDCVDGSDERNCSFSPVDKTKALVLLYQNQTTTPPSVYLNIFYGDPAQYVSRLGNSTGFPSANLSLPINFANIAKAENDSIATIAVDSKNSLVLFGNNKLQRIEWSAYINASGDRNTDYLTVGPNTQIVAIAYDWVAKNVYWSDATNQSINVAAIGRPSKNYYTTIVVENIVDPKDIAVDPVNGFLFWINGMCGEAQITRSQLNGVNPLLLNLVSALRDNCPTELSIDVGSQQLYWLDATNSRVGHVSYDGRSLHVFASATRAMSSITTFGNHYVLGSTSQRTVNFYTKGTADLVASSAPYNDPLLFVATYDVASQATAGSNSPCLVNNGGCDHLCFPTSASTATCGCATCYNLNGNSTCRYDSSKCGSTTSSATTTEQSSKATSATSASRSQTYNHYSTLVFGLAALAQYMNF